MLVGGFAGVIFIGALLLMLPWAHQPGRVNFVDALFTATSAVCVTGLVVLDTGSDFTRFGQVVILCLIQIGGLGIMTFAALAFQLLGRRLSLKSQAVLHSSYFQQDIGIKFRARFLQILQLTLAVELTGALLLFLVLLSRNTHPAKALFLSIFHAVSAFCNAGFSLYKDNLVEMRHSPVFLTTIMALIVVGGLGHTVVQELWTRFRDKLSRQEGKAWPQALSIHTRVVLRVTAALILTGCLGLLMLGLTVQETTWGSKIFGALFQSITARTAGFNSVDIGILPVSSLLLLTILMFIGASPASCGGGIKTTALAISLADTRAKVLGEKEVRLLDRRVPEETLWRVSLLIRLAVLWNLLGVLILLATEGTRPGIGLHDVLFEQISAFGTVGLSTGITDKLSVAGRLWITATMYVGRLGPLTLAIWVFPQKPVHVLHPEGRIMIG